MKNFTKRWLIPSLLGLGAVLLTLVLLVSAILICTVKVLNPDRLTPLVTRYANEMLDATVDAHKIELSFKPAFPMLKLRIEELNVLSHSLDSLPEGMRDGLPSYSDSLLSVGLLEGSVNLRRFLASGEISLSNVRIERPSANIVIAANGKSNFDIYQAAKDEVADSLNDEALKLPSIVIDHFKISDGREMRYFNAVDSTEASILLLENAELDGAGVPTYRLSAGGSFKSPLTKSYLQLDGLAFGIDGKIRWMPERPFVVSIDDFRFVSKLIEVAVDTELDFTDDFIIRSCSIEIPPVEIEKLTSILPENVRKHYKLDSPFFETNATVALAGRLSEPFNASIDSIPYADFKLVIPESTLKYGRSRMHDFALDLEGKTKGNDPDEAIVDISKFSIAGPATEISMNARFSKLVTDPAFDGELVGRMNLSNLPEIVQTKLNGFVSGNLRTDIRVEGRMSMLSSTGYHKMNVSGQLKGSDLYWLAADTANMVSVHGLIVDFDTQNPIKQEGKKTHALMSAKITSDTASMLFGGVEVNFSDLALRAGVQNSGIQKDTTVIVPVGGGISLGSLRVVSVTDKAGVRMKNLDGKVMMHRYKGDSHIPEFIVDVQAGRLAAGGGGTVGMLANAKIYAKTHKIKERAERRKRLQSTADSIRKAYPDIPADSVIALAIAKRRQPGRKGHRVKLEESNDYETIDWGTSKNFKRFLNDWELNGEIATRHARLYTPIFPLRNRINDLSVTFSTDTVNIRSLDYRGGKSDLSVSGLVTNIKRSFGARSMRSPVKVNLKIESDTIDVNELAVATFAGSDYASKGAKADEGYSIDDSKLEEDIEALGGDKEVEASPILVPYNVEANIAMSANNILYSDLTMKDFHGDILVFDGAVNLHDLSARSDAGSLSLSALYSAPNVRDMQFGFGMMLDDFKIEKFLKLVPAIDSIMPLMRDFSGTIDADLAATVSIDSVMNFELPTLDAAVKLQGDSLALINPETYRTLGKWLRFKDRTDNTIKHMNVELVIKDNKMELFPFTFDIDRYKLGVVGYNDLALNFNYHISVLKSPIPFKFGINIKGNPEHYKVRFGGAKFKSGDAFKSVAVVDTVRVNLMKQIQNVFRRGVRNSRFATLKVGKSPDLGILDQDERQLSHSDSVALIKEGFIDAPLPLDENADKKDKKKDRKNKKGKKNNNDARKDD